MTITASACLEGLWFKPRPVDRLFSLFFVIVLRTFLANIGKTPSNFITTISYHILPSPLFTAVTALYDAV
jgi:hypothetical protein